MLKISVLMLFYIFFFKAHAEETTFKDEMSKVKIGGRLQAILAQDNVNEAQDFYLRRTRLNLEYKPWEGHTFIYDIRNDGANEADDGEQAFNIGDAYWKIDIDNSFINNIKLFRAKVDVSYSQTSSSKNLFNPQRAEVSEHASDFVVSNRRAVNAQINGNIGSLAYQVVLSDGVDSRDLSGLNGNKIAKVNYQKLTYGTKLRYFFIGDAKENKSQDTFYGERDTFSLGFGYFANDKINVTNSNNATALQEFSFNRKLSNVELSYAYQNFRLLAEYFELSGDLIDLQATSTINILGKSGGYYTQVEYTIGKWAPYIIYESFDKDKEANDAVQTVTTIGLNFYQKNESARFGIAHKKTKNGKNIGDNTIKSLYAYAMLNF